VPCVPDHWCKYLVIDSENEGLVPVGATINLRADAATTTCPALEVPLDDDWAFDPEETTSCAADPTILVGGNWMLLGGPDVDPEMLFADCWARCPQDGGNP
jgi:hypothetical protein